MSRFIYDVDKITRYIDIHKQFQGGLKTVDTDDALRDIYLREAENISLSEFNFIEKRYGLHKLKEAMPWSSLSSTSSIVQGYFEYYVDANTVHKIIVIEGKFYVDQGAGYQEITLFSTENGEAVDLSSLGIFTNQDVDDAIPFASVVQFGTQSPWYYTGNPNGVVTGLAGNIIHSTTGVIYNCSGGTTWVAISGTGFPFATPIQEDEIYIDTRTNITYIWENATGYNGQFSLFNATYEASIQSTRPVEGVRLDNKLYIATGTYPVFYKGDGKIYVFRQYDPSDLDLINLGYDLNSVDIEESIYGVRTIDTTSTHGLTYIEGTETLTFDMKKNVAPAERVVYIKDKAISPKMPYVTPSSSGLTNIKLSYHIYNNADYDFYNTGFDSNATPVGYRSQYGKLGSTAIGTNTIQVVPDHILNEYFLKVTVDRKAQFAAPELYREIPETDVIVNNINNHNGGLPLNSSQQPINLDLKIKNTASGVYDFRVNVALVKKGYLSRLTKWYHASTITNSTWNTWPNPNSRYKVDLTSSLGAGTFATAANFVTYLNQNINARYANLLSFFNDASEADDKFLARIETSTPGTYFYASFKIILNDQYTDTDFISFKLDYSGTSSVNDPAVNSALLDGVKVTDEEAGLIKEIPLGLSSIEFLNINITSEKLDDYTEAPLDTLRIHKCNRMFEHNGRLGLFGNPDFPDYIFFSTIGAKEYFPYGYTAQFSNDLQEAITAVNKFMNILVVQSDSYTWGLKGDSPLPQSSLEGEPYRKLTINPTIGCIAPNSVKNVRNQLFFLSKEGIFTLRALYAEDNRYNVDPIDRNIYNIVPRDTNAVSAYFDDQYWLHFPNTGETLRYYVDKKAWVKDTYAAWNDFGGIFRYINESGKLRFITQLSQLEAGDPVKIFDIEVDYALPTDLTKNVVSKITTSYLNQNQPFHPKNYKEAKFDFAIQNEYNIGKEPILGTSFNEFQAGATKYFFFTTTLIARHFYQITLAKNEVSAGTYTVRVNGEIRKTGTFLDTNPVSLSWQPIEFQIFDTDTMPCTIEVRSSGLDLGVIDESVAVLYDSTYDHTVTFKTLVLSEEGTLNVDPIDSYTTADVAVPIDLGTRTGNWTFGTSNFGNVIVAVKTVKLSGRGYNSKVSIIEDSKSKWTLESLGITYKMKKARSR